MSQAITQLDTTATVEVKTPNFGDGRYSPLMLECWKDAQAIFHITSSQAEKLARMIGSEFGALSQMAGAGMKGITFGKANKDGAVTIKEAATKVKNVTMTYPLALLRAMNWANEAGSVGFTRGDCKFVLNGKFTDWIADKLT